MNIPGLIVSDVAPAPDPVPPKNQTTGIVPGFEYKEGEAPVATEQADGTPIHEDQVEGSIHEARLAHDAEQRNQPQHNLDAEDQFEESAEAEAELEAAEDAEEDQERNMQNSDD